MYISLLPALAHSPLFSSFVPLSSSLSSYIFLTPLLLTMSSANDALIEKLLTAGTQVERIDDIPVCSSLFFIDVNRCLDHHVVDVE